MASNSGRAVLVVFSVVALLLSSFAAAAAPEGGADATKGPPSVTRMLAVETDGGRAEVAIEGRERKLPDGKCSPITEIVKLEGEVGGDGLVLDTEVTDECRIVVSYFGKPRFQDAIEPEATESTEAEIGQPASDAGRRHTLESDQSLAAAAAWSGNYLHSRHRLHDILEVIIADFWLHNDRRWNGSGVFVCSSGWSCFVGGQSKTYKSWNHPGSNQVSYNKNCTSSTNCNSVKAYGTGNFTTDFVLCDPGDKIKLNNTNTAYRNGTYEATYSRTTECSIAGMHAHYAVWSNLTKWDQTP